MGCIGFHQDKPLPLMAISHCLISVLRFFSTFAHVFLIVSATCSFYLDLLTLFY
uniref:Uncharacterized protein n=1 Tax=Octopus bimaculoides TaxID=37653 RepID=A0A0L8HGI5_OCTBM